MNSNLSGPQFDGIRIDHSDRVVRAYRGSGEGQEFLGRMDYTVGKHVEGAVHVDNVEVQPGARRQGVARRMYDTVHEATGLPFGHVASEMSSNGKRAVRAMATANPEQHKRIARTTNGNATLRKF